MDMGAPSSHSVFQRRPDDRGRRRRIARVCPRVLLCTDINRHVVCSADASSDERVVVMTWSYAEADTTGTSSSEQDDQPGFDIAAAIDAPCVGMSSAPGERCPVTGMTDLVWCYVLGVDVDSYSAGFTASADAPNPHGTRHPTSTNALACTFIAAMYRQHVLGRCVGESDDVQPRRSSMHKAPTADAEPEKPRNVRGVRLPSATSIPKPSSPMKRSSPKRKGFGHSKVCVPV